jgi:hypothetical protein
MKPLGKIIVITIATLITLSALSGTAYAITGNYRSDSTGYVGIIVLFADPDRQQPIGYSSGVLISPTVMLTAGHATIHAVAASVSFDQGPISYSIQNGQITYSGKSPIYQGVPVTYPEYAAAITNQASQGNQIFSVTDLGIVLLSSPVEGINFATLPTAGLADTLPVKTDLQVIGYGMQDQVTPKNNGPANSWTGTLSRNSANVQLLSNNFQGNEKYIRCTANSAQNKGAISFGDSGGPMLYSMNSQSIVLALNAYVNSANCNGVSYGTRIDITQVLEWVNEVPITYWTNQIAH